MKIKKIISLILVIAIIFSFSANVYADSNSIGDSLKSIMTSIGNIVKEVIKVFKDIKESDWFAENVSMLYELGIINGKPQKDGTVIFDSKGLVTKAEFTKMLVVAMKYNLVDGSSFSDIGYNRHWAKKYIETAVKEGVINPEKEGENYWPDLPIKRFDMGMMMLKALRLEYSNNPSPFPDVDCGCITKLHEEYLINGVPRGNTNYFMPSGLTTRAEAAAIISRIIEYKENPEEFKKLQKVRNEINSIPVAKAYNIKDGKRFTNEKEFYKYQSEVLKRPYGYTYEGTDCVIIKGDDNFKDVAVVYSNPEDPNGRFAFDLEILNSQLLDGYKVKFICENRPEIMLYGDGKEKTDWMDVKVQSGLPWRYQGDYKDDILYTIKDGELLNFRIFVDSGKEIRSIDLTVKVGDNSLYRK